MLRNYPKRATRIESIVQLVLAITTLAVAAFYSVTVERQLHMDDADRLPIMMQALKISGASFLLAVSASFLRRFMVDPPLALIWAAILIVASVAWLLACLTLLSSL